ncbi:glycosyltransferase family 4 protein [Sphingomonas colocasiae]|uniref:Glycosyltransferase n=1 Tax=Sphingomonas colocasiae TaxID=1848973 RepID=A0ABS7PQV7_9SPHN|nr:glycosyltransferase [Sphingomonas colocasiae]MBY8823608.1 glycosyltransferase [Sphingomonas colocasiae]
MSSASPRIAHIVPADNLGGVETAARSMAESDRLACEFRLHFIAGETLATRTDRIAPSNGHGIAAFWRAWKRLRGERPDVVIFSLWRSVPLALALKLARPKTRIAYFIHSAKVRHVPDAICSWLASRFADQVWCDSQATLDERRDIPARASTHIISFVTSRREPPDQRALAARFVSWGRLNPIKGIDDSIRLIARLNSSGVDARFEAWGPDDGDKARLVDLAAELGVADRVAFPGPVARGRIADVAARHSFFLQLSRHEGMGMSVVEAMQLGLVPITTEVGQMAHYVQPRRTGVRVDRARLDLAVDEIVALLADQAAFLDLSRGAYAYWQSAPLYADDVCAGASALYRDQAK